MDASYIAAPLVKTVLIDYVRYSGMIVQGYMLYACEEVKMPDVWCSFKEVLSKWLQYQHSIKLNWLLFSFFLFQIELDCWRGEKIKYVRQTVHIETNRTLIVFFTGFCKIAFHIACQISTFPCLLTYILLWKVLACQLSPIFDYGW